MIAGGLRADCGRIVGGLRGRLRSTAMPGFVCLALSRPVSPVSRCLARLARAHLACDPRPADLAMPPPPGVALKTLRPCERQMKAPRPLDF